MNLPQPSYVNTVLKAGDKNLVLNLTFNVIVKFRNMFILLCW